MLLTEPATPAMRHVASVAMLFELEPDAAEANDAQQSPEAEAASQRVRALVQEAQASTQVSAVLARVTGQAQDDLVAAAQALGYEVRLRDAVGGGQGAACLRNLRHSFLILAPRRGCQQQQLEQEQEVIVDPTFKEQFLVAHPSPRYAAVLDALPPVFVGGLAAVQPLVELLCGEMALTFAAAGIVLPPWRSARSMLSKWMPRRSLDLVLPPHGAGAGAAAGSPAAPEHAQPGGRAAAAARARCPAVSHAGAAWARLPPVPALQQQLACGSAGGLSCRSGLDHHMAGSSSSSGSSSGGGGPSGVATACNSCSGSVPGSPAAPAAAAVACAMGCGAGPAGAARDGGLRRSSELLRAGPAAAVPAGLAAASRHCQEPLQRVVGGFGAH